jgi:cob(I)alamin adenosyltransferase
MRIYTRRGDQGETGLVGGERVSKADPRIEVCGGLDETSAALGLARALGLAEPVDTVVARIQEDLLLAGAEVAGTEMTKPRIVAEDLTRLEHTIDAHEAELRPLNGFIVPGGAPGPAALHLARTSCRRAERSLAAAGGHAREGSVLIAYLNRLSDLLFVLARRANALAGAAEVTWGPRDPRTRG